MSYISYKRKVLIRKKKKRKIKSVAKSKGDSITVRLDNQDNPTRRNDFLRVLEKRGANVSDIVNNLVDAYVKSDGLIIFPISADALKNLCRKS